MCRERREVPRPIEDRAIRLKIGPAKSRPLDGNDAQPEPLGNIAGRELEAATRRPRMPNDGLPTWRTILGKSEPTTIGQRHRVVAVRRHRFRCITRGCPLRASMGTAPTAHILAPRACASELQPRINADC
jgi:hypothetical protein